MAHQEQQLISRIVRTGCLSQVLEWGLTDEDFHTTEGHGWFIFLKGYAAAPDSRGAVPGVNTMRNKFPTFEPVDDTGMTLDALCMEVRTNRIKKDAEKAIKEATETLWDDPLGSLSKLSGRVNGLNALGTKVTDQMYGQAMDHAVERYERAESGQSASGITWPWDPVNAVTAGVQEDDYIVFYGRPKSMKSFVLSKFAAHSYDEGLHVMIYTKEMPAWQLFRRVAACSARLPYDELRLGKLTPQDRKALFYLRQEVNEREKMTDGRHTITTLSGRDAPPGTDNMSWLRGKIAKYEPDIVYIDGLYLMSPEGRALKDNDRVQQISRAARQMVLETHRPLIATMQANRNAAKHERAELDEIAFSDALSQDATNLIRVINEKDTPTIALVWGGSREYKMHGVRIWGIPCSNFAYKEIMTEKDIKKAETGDAKMEEGEKADSQVKHKPTTEKNKEATVQAEARAAALKEHLKKT